MRDENIVFGYESGILQKFIYKQGRVKVQHHVPALVRSSVNGMGLGTHPITNINQHSVLAKDCNPFVFMVSNFKDLGL